MQKWFKNAKVHLNNVTRQSVEEKTHSKSQEILHTKFQLTLQTFTQVKGKHWIVIIWKYN